MEGVFFSLSFFSFFRSSHYNSQLPTTINNAANPTIPDDDDDDADAPLATGIAKVAFTNPAPHCRLILSAALT